MGVPLYQAKAEFFKTLGHPVRIRLLELLSERDHAVHELLQKIAVEPSNLSQQLAVLRRTQLVVSRRQDGEVVYSISAPEVSDLLLAARRILTDLINVDIEPTPDRTPSDGTTKPSPTRGRPAHTRKSPAPHPKSRRSAQHGGRPTAS